jgi:hypothetical protein
MRSESNRLIRIEPSAIADGVVIRKSKGELTVRDVAEALIRSNYEEESFALFVHAPVFDGFTGEDKPYGAVLLYRIAGDVCPVCGKNLQQIRDDAYSRGYEDGMREMQAVQVRDDAYTRGYEDGMREMQAAQI